MEEPQGLLKINSVGSLGPGDRLLVLLHGFGADENDLAPLVQHIDPDDASTQSVFALRLTWCRLVLLGMNEMMMGRSTLKPSSPQSGRSTTQSTQCVAPAILFAQRWSSSASLKGALWPWL